MRDDLSDTNGGVGGVYIEKNEAGGTGREPVMRSFMRWKESDYERDGFIGAGDEAVEAAATGGAAGAAVVPPGGTGARDAAADGVLELVDAGGGLRADGFGGGGERKLSR